MIKVEINYGKEGPPVAGKFIWGGTWPCWQSPQRLRELAETEGQAEINAANAARRAERLEIEKVKKRKRNEKID